MLTPANPCAPQGVATPTVVDGPALFTGLWGSDLGQKSVAPNWLWQGYLAPGLITLLTSQWKSGKTTLATMLVGRLGADGPFAGLPVRAGRAAVITEESPAHWHYRRQHVPFGDNLYLLCRPFPGLPSLAAWVSLLNHVLDHHDRHGLDLVVVDSLAAFLPWGVENLASAMLQTLAPLQRLTAAGLGVWLLHHPRKGDTLAGQAARGSGALAGFVDIIQEMKWFGRPDPADRRRRLRAFSRFAETPPSLAVELNAAGNDYVVIDEQADSDNSPLCQFLVQLLAEAPLPLTCGEILAKWPGPKPAATTIWRLLQQACAQGHIRQFGKGFRCDPYRYHAAAAFAHGE